MDRFSNKARRNFLSPLQVESLKNRIVLTGNAAIAVNDAYDGIAAQPLNIAADVGVLANDTDNEGDTLTVQLFSGTQNGTLDLQADGSFSYTPNAGFTGTDSFVYQANDGASLSLLSAQTDCIDQEFACEVISHPTFKPSVRPT